MMRMAMDAPRESAVSYQDTEITIRDRVDVVFKLEEC